MADPRLTFWCELDVHVLQALFHDHGVDAHLQALHAGVSLALLDLSPERAAIVSQLNQAGIPVTAWLLLPYEKGYYLNLGNAAEAERFYTEFRDWTAQHGLRWAGIGLDIEPDIRELRGMAGQPLPVVAAWLARLFDGERLRQGVARYRDLVARIHADGYSVESYQFGMIVEERRAGSTLLQRTLGIVDVPVDREVFMLYSSFLRGPAALWSYAKDTRAIGVGSTGGGVDSGILATLSWDELARDLLLAHCWTEDIYIFSLEGCVQHGYLARLRDFDWSAPVAAPFAEAGRVNVVRSAFQGLLWTAAHPAILLAFPALFALLRLARRK